MGMLCVSHLLASPDIYVLTFQLHTCQTQCADKEITSQRVNVNSNLCLSRREPYQSMCVSRNSRSSASRPPVVTLVNAVVFHARLYPNTHKQIHSEC